MHPIIRNILAFLIGLFLANIVNISLIILGNNVIPVPEGADISSTEAMQETMHLLKPQNYLFPFLAHALGSFTGGFVIAKLAAKSKMKLALAFGILYLSFGLYMIAVIPAPTWFSILDGFIAYLPMTYFGAKLTLLKRK
ncbi:hypothetical protein [Empedobacter brevis]|uniref:hypothetical protein n=1 Tax=Empedobacter brevis TaxID=247 RepID=UPI0039AFC50D